MPMDDYLDSVSIDVRFNLPPEDLPWLIDMLDGIAGDGVDISYPSDDGLPYEHTLPIFQGVVD